MTKYEAYYLILELESKAGYQGEYFVTALFAFVMVVYLFGTKMSKAMLAVLTAIYSSYAFLNIVAMRAHFVRINDLEETYGPVVSSEVWWETSQSYAATYVPLFWFLGWAASMFFMYLVLRQKMDHANT